MTIRPYQSADFDDVRRVCLETCSDPFLLAHTEVLYTVYADSYILEEPQSCFVAVDENGRVEGYTLCSTDAKAYADAWHKTYFKRISKGGFYWFLQHYSILHFKKMTRAGYPAHLHIDLSPSVQHQGVGTQLLNALFDYLKEKEVPGIYLGCSVHNEVGNAFYQKKGFSLFAKRPGLNVYVKKV